MSENKKEYNWFIIKCPCGSEDKFVNELKSNLLRLKAEDLLKDFFIPNLIEKPKGKITMGSYVFINASKCNILDLAIYRIPFASYLLDGSTNPAKISQVDIDIMKEKEQDVKKQEEENNKIEIGQKILIQEGPFKDFEGTIEKIQTDKISVNINVLGSPLSLDLPCNSITVIKKIVN